MANHMLVLDEGRLLDNGSHEELMAPGAHCATIVNQHPERYP